MLQDRLNALRADLEVSTPAASMAVIRRTLSDLARSSEARRSLGAGQIAPDFILRDEGGRRFASRRMLEQGPIVLSFYLGSWCGFCNLDLEAVEHAADALRGTGVTIAAISQQTPAHSRITGRDLKLSYPILADRGGVVGAAFGLRWTVPAELREVYSKLEADLPSYNGEASWTLPMPARYVIGQDGVIAYAEVSPDYMRRPDPSELFPILQRLRLRQG